MLWGQVFELFVIQVVIAVVYSLLWAIFPSGIKELIGTRWKYLMPIVWVITFLLIFTLDDFITAAIVATTTVYIGKFRFWLTYKPSQKPIHPPKKKCRPNTYRFSSVRSFYER